MNEDCIQAFEEWVADKFAEANTARDKQIMDIRRQAHQAGFEDGFQAGRASIPAPQVTDEMVDNAINEYKRIILIDQHKIGLKNKERYAMRSALQAALGGSHDQQ